MNTTTKDKAQDDVILPVLKYGYRETPLQWNEVQQIVLQERNYDRLTRSASQQRDYEINKRAIQHEWASVHDYVLCTKFEIPFEMHQGRKRAMSKKDITPQTTLVRNDFSYCFEQSIQHWILWKLGGACTDHDIVTAKQDLQVQIQVVHDMLHWINPPRLQSLPGIDHVHILVYQRTL